MNSIHENNENKQTKKPEFSVVALGYILEENKISVSYEPVKKDVTWTWAVDGGDRKLAEAKIIEHIQTTYTRYTKDRFANCIKILSLQNEQNVMLDKIDLTFWDNHNYLEDLYDILNIPAEDELSRTLIFKWLWQGLVLLENDEDDPVGADGCLVLTGLQGIGKTSVFRKLAIDKKYFGEGCTYNHRDKDSLIDIVKNFVSELGEIETTFRADIEALKNFVTRAKDRIRFPYDAKASEMARRTNLCGTCNSKGFLIDQNGNRRFWTVPVENIDLDRLAKFDSLQLWSQIREMTIMLPQHEFRLSKEERRQLEERNKDYMKYLPVEAEIRDILAMVEEDAESYAWVDMTVTEWKEMYPNLSRTSSDKIGRVLQKLGIESRATHVDGNKARLRNLPKKIGLPY